jgi:division protein CdvB (Snf7/Vps24/ESCRT-III family)
VFKENRSIAARVREAFRPTPIRKRVMEALFKTQLEGVLPEASLELSSVNESLEYLVLEVGEATEQSFDMSVTSDDGQKILSEANVVAEQKMRERFPDLPAVPTQEARVQ